MKKFNSFEEKLGAYMMEYAYYTTMGVSMDDAYHDPDTYPFFRHMCDAIMSDVIHAQTFTDPKGYLLRDTHQLMQATISVDVDGLCGTYVYNVCAKYAKEVQKYMRDKFNTYMRDK